MTLKRHECARCKREEVADYFCSGWEDIYDGVYKQEVCAGCVPAWKTERNARGMANANANAQAANAPLPGYEAREAAGGVYFVKPDEPDTFNEAKRKLARAGFMALFAALVLFGFYAEVALTTMACSSLGIDNPASMPVHLIAFCVYAAGVGFAGVELFA